MLLCSTVTIVVDQYIQIGTLHDLASFQLSSQTCCSTCLVLKFETASDTVTVQIDVFMNPVCAMKTVPEQYEYPKTLSRCNQTMGNFEFFYY